MKKTRKRNLKEARTLQIWNVIYDIIEVVVSLIAGFTSNSSALIGWGLDSTIEVISAGTLGWRLHGEIKGIDEKSVEIFRVQNVDFFWQQIYLVLSKKILLLPHDFLNPSLAETFKIIF